MGPHDEETERYLRGFRPRAIRPLEIAPKVEHVLLRRLAVAAAVTVFAAGTLWFAHRETRRRRASANPQTTMENVTRERQYPSSLALTRLALEDSEKLDSVLADQSRHVLPLVQGKESTLKVLAKD